MGDLSGTLHDRVLASMLVSGLGDPERLEISIMHVPIQIHVPAEVLMVDRLGTLKVRVLL